MILLYHHIGSKILRNQKQHGWGAKVIDQISKDLKDEFPDMKGFSPTNLKYMRLFAESFTSDEIGQQAADQLPWFHLVTILVAIKNPLERKFYIEKTRQHGWSRTILSMQIDTKLYQREGMAVTNF